MDGASDGSPAAPGVESPANDPLLSPLPARSRTAVVPRTSCRVPASSAGAGVKVAHDASALTATVPRASVPSAAVTVKLVAVTDAGLIGSEKQTVTALA